MVGVGSSRFTACPSGIVTFDPSAFRPVGETVPSAYVLEPTPSDAHGVGSSLTAIAKGVPKPFPFPWRSFCTWRRVSHDTKSSPSFGFPAAGVGSNDEQPRPLVAGTNVARSNDSPFRIEPEVGQVTEHDVESERKVA